MQPYKYTTKFEAKISPCDIGEESFISLASLDNLESLVPKGVNFKDNIERAAPLAGMYLRFLPRYVYSAEKFRKVLELVTYFCSFRCCLCSSFSVSSPIFASTST